MKNFINYYYNFNIYDLYFNNGKYFFNNENDKYMLKLCENTNIQNLYDELQSILNKYIYFFNIIPNINKNYITWIEDKPFILLKLSNIKNYQISIFDIKNDLYISPISNKLLVLNRFPWTNFWENKIDYFEEWFNNKQDSYNNLLSLFYYFIGISENALLYFKETEKEEKKEASDELVISHNRINIFSCLFDYYDPTNIIVDHPSRDVSEYIKSLFINRIWDIEILSKYLDKNYFSRYGLRMIYSRILFPSFFFDYIEDMILKNQNIDLLYLETRLNEFENFIKEISIYLNEKYKIPVISWIIKKT